MAMKARYTVIDGEVVSEVRSGVRKDYVPDPLGSTVALLDNTQTKTDTWEYWHYGEVRSGSSATPFQFVGTLGYYRDTSARTYVRARHYKQNFGRWTTVVRYIPFEAAYEYSLDSPVFHVDTTGLYVESGGAVYTDTLNLGGVGGPTYGHYCGAENYHIVPPGPPCRGQPAVPPKPRDCLDKACQIHDNCQPPHVPGYDYFHSPSAYKCNCALATAAFKCFTSGCGTDFDRSSGSHWTAIGQCKDAAFAFYTFFEALCLAPTKQPTGHQGK